MKPLIIEATDYTPYVCFDKDKELLEIIGISKPANAFEFFDPLLLWLDDYLESPRPKTVLSMRLEYLNTSSAKFVNYIIKKLERLLNKNKELLIIWHYSVHEPEMRELGENYATLYSVPFEFKSHDE